MAPSKARRHLARSWAATALAALAIGLLSGCSEESSSASPRRCDLPEHTLAHWRETFLERAATIEVVKRSEGRQFWRLLDHRGRRQGSAVELSRVDDSGLWISSTTRCI